MPTRGQIADLAEVWRQAGMRSAQLPSFSLRSGWTPPTLSTVLGYVDYAIDTRSALAVDAQRMAVPGLGPSDLVAVLAANDLLLQASNLTVLRSGESADGWPLERVLPWLAMAAGLASSDMLHAWQKACDIDHRNATGLLGGWSGLPAGWDALSFAAGLTADEARSAHRQGLLPANGLAQMAAARGSQVHADLLATARQAPSATVRTSGQDGGGAGRGAGR